MVRWLRVVVLMLDGCLGRAVRMARGRRRPQTAGGHPDGRSQGDFARVRILADAVSEVLGGYTSHFPEYQLWHLTRLLGDAITLACEERGLDLDFLDDMSLE